MPMNSLDHARNAWLGAQARLEALERGRFTFAFQAWVGAAEIRAYDQQIAAMRAVRDEKFAEFKMLKAVAPTSRPVKIARKHTPIALPRPAAPRPLTAAQREAQRVQAHARHDAIAWRLFGR